MRSRKWISVLAVLGVLLHAGVLVRHNAAMAGAALEYQTLLAGLSQICHGGGTGTVDPSELPYVPPPNDAQNGCPICSGVASAVALAAPPIDVALVLAPAASDFSVEIHRPPAAAHHLHPPARGPPQAA